MIHVKWNKDILHFPLSLDTPLGQLRTELAAYTQLKVGSFKLVYKGAVMKDDSALLETYGVKQGGTIWLIGGDDGAARLPKLKPAKTGTDSATEEGTIQAIQAELESIRERVVPEVEAFVGGPTETVHLRLSEILLQSLLRLDAMVVPGVEWPEARVQRKAAVREVQGVLDRLDGAWAAR